mgnify:CR=1 FL=1
MTPHIEANVGDYADIVLLPGDPLRAKFIAENFLDDIILVNSVRNCLGYTGVYKGQKVSVQASGMGQASLGIYVHELFNFYNVEKIIRVGSCGGISPKVKVGDIIVAMSAATDSAMTDDLVPGFRLSPCCDYCMLKNYLLQNDMAHVGQMVSNDYFYQPNENWYIPLKEMGILAVDMETHVLYNIANRFCKKALSINTVSDHLTSGEQMSSKEREQGFGFMIETILESI